MFFINCGSKELFCAKCNFYWRPIGVFPSTRAASVSLQFVCSFFRPTPTCYRRLIVRMSWRDFTPVTTRPAMWAVSQPAKAEDELPSRGEGDFEENQNSVSGRHARSIWILFSRFNTPCIQLEKSRQGFIKFMTGFIVKQNTRVLGLELFLKN